MRSRPRVRTFFGERPLVPGSRFQVTVRFDSKTPTPYERLVVTLVRSEAFFASERLRVTCGTARFPAGLDTFGSSTGAR